MQPQGVFTAGGAHREARRRWDPGGGVRGGQEDYRDDYRKPAPTLPHCLQNTTAPPPADEPDPLPAIANYVAALPSDHRTSLRWTSLKHLAAGVVERVSNRFLAKSKTPEKMATAIRKELGENARAFHELMLTDRRAGVLTLDIVDRIHEVRRPKQDLGGHQTCAAAPAPARGPGPGEALAGALRDQVALDLGEQREERGHDLRLDVAPPLDADVLLERHEGDAGLGEGGEDGDDLTQRPAEP